MSEMEVLETKWRLAAWLTRPVADEVYRTVDREVWLMQGIDNSPTVRLTGLKESANYWVASDMVDLVEAAHSTMPDDDVLLEEPPSRHGFLLLARPIRRECTDLRCTEDHDHQLIGVHWRPAHRVVPDSPAGFGKAMQLIREGHDAASVRDALTRAGITGEQHDDGFVITWLAPPDDSEFTRRYDPPVEEMFGAFWPSGRPLNIEATIAEGALTEEGAARARYLRATWTLMQQTLADTSEHHPPRGLRRRMQRAGQDEPSSVTVITLRRRAGHGERQGQPVDWSHRWVVSGHWRRQWHPSLQRHRPVWIADHIKGPDDKPLVVKDKVYAWRR